MATHLSPDQRPSAVLLAWKAHGFKTLSVPERLVRAEFEDPNFMILGVWTPFRTGFCGGFRVLGFAGFGLRPGSRVKEVAFGQAAISTLP